MNELTGAKGLFWNIIAGLITGYITRYFDIKDMDTSEIIVLILYFIFLILLVCFFIRDKKKLKVGSNVIKNIIKDNLIKLNIDKNLPTPKAISTSQDLIDRWDIDWKKLSAIINLNCLPAHYHSGIPGDYQPIDSIEYEGDFHNDKTQKETILSFYFKESDVKHLENILKNIATQPTTGADQQGQFAHVK